ncbi:tyrosine-type recombinase/integrase [Candidatus Bathyarchaeota archaeon]|nr:tyrosine-type recombinase/integrase [Candidatus Bathyarchaeota archaeon]
MGEAGFKTNVSSKLRSQPLKCPLCGSKRLYKDGLRYLADGTTVQRYLCRDCGYRFTLRHKNSKSLKYKKTSGAHQKALLMEALKNTEKSGTAGATEKDEAEVKGKIVEFLWWMKKKGYSESTILSKGQILKRLVRLNADLFNPETVSEVIARQKNWSPGRKAQVIYAYALFAKWMKINWEIPKISVPEKLPFIPTEKELNDLIAGCSNHVAVALQIAKETGARVGEIFALKWTDIDFEKSTITITPEKGSNPRIFKMSVKLRQMLRNMPKTEMRILSRYKNVNSLRRTFERQRRRIAFKLGNPRLLRISFHTFRHWKGTWEYYKTKDILHVMQVLGHKNIKNTLKYTQLAKFEGEDQYICKVAKEPKQIASLIEAGFTYVCEKDGLLFFRKRK